MKYVTSLFKKGYYIWEISGWPELNTIWNQFDVVVLDGLRHFWHSGHVFSVMEMDNDVVRHHQSSFVLVHYWENRILRWWFSGRDKHTIFPGSTSINNGDNWSSPETSISQLLNPGDIFHEFLEDGTKDTSEWKDDLFSFRFKIAFIICFPLGSKICACLQK